MHVLSPTWLQAAAQSPTDTMFWVPLIGIVAVFWFLLIRPQQKQQQKQKTMLAALRKGDQVVTQAGLFGKVHSIADKEVVLEIGNGVKVRWLKSQIAGVEKAEEAPAPEAEKAEKKE
ncbi:MAG: preprotein translocase subunit YajC [Myxococcales bacterium]